MPERTSCILIRDSSNLSAFPSDLVFALREKVYETDSDAVLECTSG